MRHNNPTSFSPPKRLSHLMLTAIFASIFFSSGKLVWADNYIGLVNLSNKTTITTSRYYYDRSNAEIRLTATITNTSSEPINMPLVLAFRNIPAGVTLVSDGTLPDGTPYVDFTDCVSGGVLGAGVTTREQHIAFVVPGQVRFSPTMSVWGTPVLSVTAVANPASGYAPLPVSFSAVAAGNIVKYEWDFTDDGVYDFTSTTSANTSYTYATVGSFTARIRVTSADGATVTDTVVISTAKGIEASLTAAPLAGAAPLTVSFTPGGQSYDGTITMYRLDYVYDPSGPPSWDWSYGRNDTTTYTYSLPGTYYAALQVEDNRGRQDLTYVTIVVSAPPPTAVASVTPTNGPAPLQVNFSGSGNSPNGRITLYEWDFDGDGTYDWSSSTTGNTVHTYISPGNYQPTFRVTDVVGLTATVSDLLIEVRVGPPRSPTAKANASPVQGNAPLTVNLNATGSSDPDGSIVLYEWDFDYDGAFATDWSSASTGTTSHVYTQAGPHYATLRVTDNDSMSAMDIVEVTVLINVSLSITNNTFNPTAQQTGGIRTTLSADVSVSIKIKNRGEQIMRTLISNAVRAAGTYNDAWDGKDDGGNTVSDGPYFAILEYKLGSQTYTYDLTHTTGGSQYQPSQWATKTTFAPYNNDFTYINYNLSVPSEVIVNIGDINKNERIRQLLNRVPQGAGTKSVMWDGLTDDGRLARPQSSGSYSPVFLYAVFAYRLPNNTLFVEGASPTISNPAASKNYYDPTARRKPEQAAETIVSFNLSRPGDVTLRVYSMDTNRLIRTIKQTGLPAGGNAIAWDGRDESELFVVKGDYRLGLLAEGPGGYTSPMIVYVPVFLYY